MPRLFWVGVIAALTGPAVAPAAVRADLITFEFTGQMTSVNDPLGLFNGSYAVGQTVTGSYTFPTTPDDVIEFGGHRIHLWFGGPIDFRVQAGGQELAYDPNSFLLPLYLPFQINLFDNVAEPFLTGDGYLFGAQYLYPDFFASPGHLVLSPEFVIRLTDPTGTALSSLDLPLTPPNVTAFAGREGAIALFDIDASEPLAEARFTLTSLQAVPEPSTVALLAVGLVALGGARLRRALRTKATAIH